MSRSLFEHEHDTLVELRDRIEEIVATGTQQELALTGVLAGSTTVTDYAVFHARFQQLGTILRDLMAERDKIKVNESLSASMGATTRITWGMEPELQDIELAPALLSSNPRVLTSNAITLIHELSHAIRETRIYPVKDYAYRSGWSLGYVSPVIAECNADTFAEAAALLAEKAEGRPGQYREPERTAARRRELRKWADWLTVGPALAWTDLVVTRAWLRIDDYEAMARTDAATADDRTKQLAYWQGDQDLAALMQIETELQNAGIIGARYAGWIWDTSIGLSKADKATVVDVKAFISAVHGAVSQLVPVPVDDGQTVVTYDATSRTLRIPRAVTDRGPVALSGLIIDAVVAGLGSVAPDTQAFNDHKRQIVDMLVLNDRPLERAALQADKPRFETFPHRVPDAEEWRDLATGLQLAIVEDIVAQWKVVAVQVADTAASKTGLDILPSLDKSLATDIKEAAAIAAKLVGEGVTVPTKQFTELAHIVSEIGARVVENYQKKAPAYQELLPVLAPFLA